MRGGYCGSTAHPSVEPAANAIEHAYGPRQGRVHVAASQAGGAIEIVITDNGGWRGPRGADLEPRRGMSIRRGVIHDVDVRTGPTGSRVKLRRHADQVATP